MFKRRTLAQLIAAASLAPASGRRRAAPPLIAHRLRLLRRATPATADLGRRAAYHPDLFIFAGDNVYGDFNTADAADLKQAYESAQDIAGYTRLRGRCRISRSGTITTMASMTAAPTSPQGGGERMNSSKFWNVPADDVRRSREGIYNARIIGPPGMRVQVVLLDLRWFRSPLKPTDQRGAPGKERYVPDADPAKTMLGDAQWAWLAARAAQAGRGAALVSTIAGAGRGPWLGALGQFPARAPEAVRHDPRQQTPTASCCCRATAISARSIARRRRAGYPLYEITSSGLNMVLLGRAASPDPIAWAASMPAANFGVVDIDWWEHKVTLALRDESGRTRSVRYSQLH